MNSVSQQADDDRYRCLWVRSNFSLFLWHSVALPFNTAPHNIAATEWKEEKKNRVAYQLHTCKPKCWIPQYAKPMRRMVLSFIWIECFSMQNPEYWQRNLHHSHWSPQPTIISLQLIDWSSFSSCLLLRLHVLELLNTVPSDNIQQQNINKLHNNPFNVVVCGRIDAIQM